MARHSRAPRWLLFGFILLVTALLVCGASAQAQEPPTPTDSDVAPVAPVAPPIWATLGIGATWVTDAEGRIAFGGGLSMAITESIVGTLRARHAEQFQLCLWNDCDEPARQTEVAALAGFVDQGSWHLFTGSLGAGIAFGRRRVDTTTEAYTIPVLAAEVQLYFVPLRFLGLGATIFANLGTAESTAGLLFGFQLGRLR